MDAKELRIGNLIDFNRVDILKIESILSSTCRVFCHSLDEEKLIEFSINHISPIPLTEEWLLKFGFEKDESYSDVEAVYVMYRQMDSDVYATKDKDGFFNYGLGFQDFHKQINYVHTFQNYFYALNDQELAVK